MVEKKIKFLVSNCSIKQCGGTYGLNKHTSLEVKNITSKIRDKRFL